MKNLKTFSKLAFLALSAFMLSSFSPSLDGRAVVVDEGVMPSGLFAKTVGYLPGDVISVSNVAENKTIDILVIGALDPSEGVAIMLTPEAAKACGIEKDSNSIVKITKRNGQDDRVYGNAVITSDNPAASEKNKNPENPAADSVAEEVFQEENTEELNAASEVAEESPVAGLAEKTDDSENAENSENTAESPVEKADEEVAVLENSEENTFASLQPLEKIEEPEVAESEEDFVPSDFIYEEDEIASDSPLPSPVIIPEESQPVIAETDTVEDVNEVSEVTELSETSDENSDTYDAIVLVPALANPPVLEEKEENPVISSSKEPDINTSNPVKNEKALTPALNVSYQSLMVSGPSDLRPHSYYIQIATMKDDTNIQELVNKYGSNYPITIVPLRNNSKQILIGSLNMDEYAVVLERFKSYGYKDAFLRKIK